MFCKKETLKHFANLQKNTCLRVSFSIKSKPTTILKKRLWHQCFPENFVKLSRIPFRGGFRRGDLVTCHPLFSDMTLQSQILVIESLFLTSVSKFIRKYLLSDTFQTCTPLALIPLPPLSNLTTIFFRKNYR